MLASEVEQDAGKALAATFRQDADRTRLPSLCTISCYVLYKQELFKGLLADYKSH